MRLYGLRGWRGRSALVAANVSDFAAEYPGLLFAGSIQLCPAGKDLPSKAPLLAPRAHLRSSSSTDRALGLFCVEGRTECAGLTVAVAVGVAVVVVGRCYASDAAASRKAIASTCIADTAEKKALSKERLCSTHFFKELPSKMLASAFSGDKDLRKRGGPRKYQAHLWDSSTNFLDKLNDEDEIHVQTKAWASEVQNLRTMSKSGKSEKNVAGDITAEWNERKKSPGAAWRC
eukprot:scaffold795_cov375-Prasinococcus_capsulatus_cf.AAC.9